MHNLIQGGLALTSSPYYLVFMSFLMIYLYNDMVKTWKKAFKAWHYYRLVKGK